MDQALTSRAAAVVGRVRAAPGAARTLLIRQLCGGDSELQAEVERQLGVAPSGASAMGGDIGGATVGAGTGEGVVGAGVEIPGYRLVRLLGEGGMGAVYEAEQEQPRRRVALKVIGASLVTPTLVRRFEREAEILARLSHVGIAQIYQVGVGTARGRALPFIAMELVEGEGLTAAAEHRRLGQRERLELAVKLCEAVQHAHDRGVIHRDLKPANVLVDRAGRPKILDFGVARLAGGDAQLATLRTEMGQLVGTAAYMSPEQAAGDLSRIDGRSDVYALGVVIFELLTGRRPHQTEQLPIVDAIRVIREQEPTRLGSVMPSMRGDVETILARALEREPSRRYQTAGELGADIARYLEDRPIVARPASRWYRAQKFARRNKAVVVGVAGVIVALAAGLVGTGVALWREGRARQEAEASGARAEAARVKEATARTAADQERARAELAREREAAARASAEASAARAAAAAGFLERVLLGLDPTQTQGRDTALLRDMLARAERELQEEGVPPAVRGEMRLIIGRTYTAIFDYAKAIGLLEPALKQLEDGLPRGGPMDAAARERAEAMTQGRLALAQALSRSDRPEDAEREFRAAIASAADRGDRAQRLSGMVQLATLRMDRGDWSGALEIVDEATPLAQGGRSLEIGRLEQQRGAVLRRLRRIAEAEAAHRRALEIFEQEGAKIDESVATNSLALLARERGDAAEAERLYRRAIQIRTDLDPRPNPDTAASLTNLGRLLNSTRRYGEAEPVLERALEQHVALFGSSNTQTAMAMGSLSETLSNLGKHERAIELGGRSVRIVREGMPARHIMLVTVLAGYSGTLHRADRDAEAEPVMREAIQIADELKLDPRVFAGRMRISHGRLLQRLGRGDEARSVLAEAARVFGDAEPSMEDIRSILKDLDEGRSEKE